MKRKVIQIAAISEAKYSNVLYVLCDDGTLWYRDMTVHGKWQAIEDVPQPSPPSKEWLRQSEERFAEMKEKLSGKGRTAVEPS